MDPIRVFFAGADQFRVRKVKAAVVRQPDMVVVGEGDYQGVDLLLELGRQPVDVLVLPVDEDTIPGAISHVFSEHPGITVVGLGKEGRPASLYQLQLQVTEVADVSPTGLVEAIRSAVLEA